MDVATTLYEGLERVTRTLGVARAAGYATTSRAVDLVRAVARLAFTGLTFVSVLGAASLVGTLSGLH